MNHYFEYPIQKATAEMMRNAGLLNAAGCNYGYAFDIFLEKGIVICIVPKEAPESALNDKDVIPDIEAVKWDAYINGNCIPVQLSWQDAAEAAIVGAIDFAR